MSITVNTNMSSLICQRSLTKATSGMNTALQRMSTGLKINSAKDDAAGCAISSKMDYKLSSYGVAQDNAQMGQSMLDTASGSLSVMNGMLQRMRDLSEQAANGTYGKEERQAMQAEVDALTKELYRIKNTTDFNGKKVLGEEEEPFMSPTISMSEITDLSAVSNSEIIGISTAEDLQKLAEFTNNGNNITKDRTFVLTSDIDLSNIDNWTPIGNSRSEYGIDSKSFQGTFDGNGFTISNLKMDNTVERVHGLFGKIQNAIIKNVNLENVDINAGPRTGGLVGISDYESKINNCSVTSGSINGNGASTGGLVGWSRGDTIISNCYTNIEVKGTRETGGLVGNNVENSTITNSYSSGEVSSSEHTTGGLVGNNSNNAIIKNSATTSIVKQEGTIYGAFIGAFHSGEIINCEYNQNINGASIDVGGQAIIPIPTGSVTHNPNLNLPKEDTKKDICKVNLQVGINSDENSVITVDSGFEMGYFKVNLSTEESARKSIDKLDAMMAKVNAKQLDIGATSNRLASTMEFQSVQMSALTSANSLIKDADIAKESASYIKNQILQQTTATLLATANQNPSIALSLV